MDSVVNINGYRFVDLPDRDALQAPQKCVELELKGTIFVTEACFFLAGSQTQIDGFVQYPGAANVCRYSRRFLIQIISVSSTDVRLKKEIISLGLDHIKPAEFTGEEITPTEFKEWLDAGKEVLVLDTRNDYECRVGTFETAMELDIKSFRDFPRAVSEMPDDLKDTPVVMFCTGGIRCEKASVVMLDAGFTNVKQLKGGILGYFEGSVVHIGMGIVFF